MVGVELLNIGKSDNVNILVETSGRDIAMFEYIEKFFPASTNYQKLALHFTINDLKHAETSVDTRMLKEIDAGRKVLEGAKNPSDIVNVNLGGPYGSSVLAGVEADSERDWGEVQGRDGWQFATININGNDDMSAWTFSSDSIGAEKFAYE